MPDVPIVRQISVADSVHGTFVFEVVSDAVVADTMNAVPLVVVPSVAGSRASSRCCS